ncbi:unnamed protein product [Caenorhabditis bovis]|uniref:PHD finger protein 14 n=1 Tax=Caenorhabditis bovis TaxID=2654633 RepID=A0A8S1EJE0_9PELO|nr:unnamed protein product [Caenorhabditis bovis]
MSNGNESSIFGKMTSRPAGKRQIKPTALLFETLNAAENESDDDDEDFNVKTDSDKESNASTSNSDEESSDSDEDEEEQEADGSEDSKNAEDDDLEIQICAVCVNCNSKGGEEFMSCDSCGVTVHEHCYGGVICEESDDEDSTKSTTTNWFCEPCIYGVDGAPYCEFCPSRIGAFKRSDVGGRWIHLSCALFTPGISFAIVESLTGVSWQELGNSAFGKRACSICKDRVESRVGISTRCESGLCKEYFHISCAQKLGLLVDETDQAPSGETASLMRYIFCKKHCNIDKAKKQHLLYLKWEKQEIRRITMNQHKKPIEAREKKRLHQMREKLNATFCEMKDVTINIPTIAIEKAKRARYLNTSYEYLDKFEDKAVAHGCTPEEFRAPFYNISRTNSTAIPLGFSEEFRTYMNMRDSILIPEEEKKIISLRSTLAEKKAKQQNEAIKTKIEKNEQLITEKMQIICNINDAIRVICDRKNENVSALLHQFEISFEGNGSEKSSLAKIASCKQGKKSTSTTFKASPLPDQQRPTLCDECKKNTDLHLMTQCDECHKFYHIGCLKPPLIRLPKRTAKYGWICHNCNESDDEQSNELNSSHSPVEALNRHHRVRRAPKRHAQYTSH